MNTPLTRLGFNEDEVFACSAWPDGLLLAIAMIEGSKAYLAIDTKLRLDISLHGAFVHDRKLPIERVNQGFGVCHTTQFTALGRTRDTTSTVFQGALEAGNDSAYAGRIGVRYFNDAIIALDAAGPAIGLTARPVDTNNGPKPRLTLQLLDGTLDKLPVTSAMQDQHGYVHNFQICTSEIESCVYMSSLKSLWPRTMLSQAAKAMRDGTTIPLELQFPNGGTLQIRCHVQSDPSVYYTSIGAAVTGSLGVDVLRSWVQVFDFPRNELRLYDYSSIED